MSRPPPPFARFEFLVAWRYLRSTRAEGGVSLMTWISLIGITLAVFALIATMAVRAGFRAEYVDTILGANAHVTVYQAMTVDEYGRTSRSFTDYAEVAERINAVPGITRAAPLVRGQVLANLGNANSGAEVLGIRPDDLMTIPRIARPEAAQGDIARFSEGIAIGSGIARALGVIPGDRIRLVSPNGARTAMGTAPRASSYEVVYIFTAGRYDIDQTRIYMPLEAAQLFFNRDGVADEIEVMVEEPEEVEAVVSPILAVSGERALAWTWRDASGAFLRALTVEDNVMYVIMSILVLIASMNIITGLVMLVKNKGRDIGILRTMGLTEGSILRIFFLCGAGIGTIGTLCGVALGCLAGYYFEEIFAFVSWLSGGGLWDPAVRPIYNLPARLRLDDVVSAMVLSLVLSWTVTLIPARRAARMNPVEALRNE